MEPSKGSSNCKNLNYTPTLFRASFPKQVCSVWVFLTFLWACACSQVEESNSSFLPHSPAPWRSAWNSPRSVGGPVFPFANADPLPIFQSLCLRQNLIKCIENLEELQSLRELDLYDNQIKKIENLEALTELEWVGRPRGDGMGWVTGVTYPLPGHSPGGLPCARALRGSNSFLRAINTEGWN